MDSDTERKSVHLHSIDIITQLPIEVSLQILGYLDAKELCWVANVCRHWRELANDDAGKRVPYLIAY